VALGLPSLGGEAVLLRAHLFTSERVGTVRTVLSRPDSQSFTKFLISAGALLIVAAVVVPAFALRDTDVLEVSRDELKGLTATGRTEIERRQSIATDLGHAAPWVAGALFLVGIGLLGAGLPRLWRQERTQDEQQAMEMARLRAELKPQTPAEREKRLRAEVVEDLETDEPVIGHVLPQDSLASEVSTREHLEERVVSRLAVIASPLYELQSQVKAPDSNLFLDALLVGQVDQVPDIVVEIKTVGRHAVRNVNNRMREAESQLLRYMSRFRRQSIGWLILILAEEIPLAERERVEAAAANVRDVYEVSIVRPEEIDDLRLPIAV